MPPSPMVTSHLSATLWLLINFANWSPDTDELICYVLFISWLYFIVVEEHFTESNLQKEEFIWAHTSRGIKAHKDL